ncbi:hypothetical protein [Chryseobacterium koreense]|uniref:Beta-carotene 15,15'-monooxygenase n=1 Tax=Chryseobacterium koreense CCUG 49689 TaxID=1304281 RepID=A0A0J7J019_9FLAO|nr:hypothetical protein [Chryseobacterium koreense]KMQ71803.1 beta-carotene 15,15'-monooxygenase [Chryseobacterium koreense CCUG 49689]MBB5334294.1 hypothetical protein [Chryseobacterium koreense]
MDAFQEFDQPSAPQKSTGAIISHALETYKGVFLYALLAMVIYIVASMLIQAISGFDSKMMMEEIRDSSGDYSSLRIWEIPGMRVYYGLSGLVGVLMAPLYVGLIYVANKYDFKEQIQISDLFIGYRQNLVNILIYSIISSIILAISFALCVLPGFFVMPLLLLGYPILLFENASFGDAISKSFQIAKENYGVMLGTSVLGLLISLSGILLCFVGILLTFMFFLVVMYSAYTAFLGRPKQVEFKS